VEIAWRAGLVVVAASGNLGPTANSTVTPGIDPYAITVGASDDAGTVTVADDSLAPFSSWGTAYSDPKPDLVAPGRRIVSISVPGSALDLLFPDRIVRARNGAAYLRLSGTSQATGVVSGAVALLLQHSPGLAPDQVKSTLVTSTRAFGTTPAANPVARGSGLLDVSAAAASVPAPSGEQIQGTAVIGTITHAARPANAFARSVYPLLARLPLRWKDPTLGGIDWNAFTWDSVGWDDSVAWDNFDWDSVGWDESVAWDSVGWDSVGWDSVGWDSVGWDESVAWDSSGFD